MVWSDTLGTIGKIAQPLAYGYMGGRYGMPTALGMIQNQEQIKQQKESQDLQQLLAIIGNPQLGRSIREQAAAKLAKHPAIKKLKSDIGMDTEGLLALEPGDMIDNIDFNKRMQKQGLELNKVTIGKGGIPTPVYEKPNVWEKMGEKMIGQMPEPNTPAGQTPQGGLELASIGPQGPTFKPPAPPSETEKKEIRGLEDFAKMIDRIEPLLKTNKDLMGPIKNWQTTQAEKWGETPFIGQALGGMPSQSIIELNQLSKDMKDTLARLRTGAQINEYEFKLYDSLVPTADVPYETAITRLKTLRRTINDRLKSRGTITGQTQQPTPEAIDAELRRRGAIK